MSRTIAIAILAGVLSAAASATPPLRQLVAPNFNPGLRTVPFVPHSQSVNHDASCVRQLVARVDSGTVIAGPDGRVAHLTGMADSGVGAAELAITSISADGLTAAADFLVCTSSSWVSPAPVSAAMPLSRNASLESIAIRTQSNSITLQTR
jgi:hypothetical protein